MRFFDGDNGAGHVAAKQAMEHAINMAQEKGIAVVGVRRIGHSGALSYFVEQASASGMIGISLCQSGSMVVPFGGSEVYYGTNPIAFQPRVQMINLLPLIWRRRCRHGVKFSMRGLKT